MSARKLVGGHDRSPSSRHRRKAIGIDTHNHIDVPVTAAEMPGPDFDFVGEMKRSGLSAICMTFATDYDRFRKGLASMDKQLESNGMKRSLTLVEVRAAHENKQPNGHIGRRGRPFSSRPHRAGGRSLRTRRAALGLLHDSYASVSGRSKLLLSGSRRIKIRLRFES